MSTFCKPNRVIVYLMRLCLYFVLMDVYVCVYVQKLRQTISRFNVKILIQLHLTLFGFFTVLE
jgi:hypothetical protein